MDFSPFSPIGAALLILFRSYQVTTSGSEDMKTER
jgi:hypothetical protein